MMSKGTDQYTYRSAGFTVVELVLVIIVLGILAAFLITPKIYSTDRMTLDAEVKRLLADVRYTQALSMYRNARYRLNLSGSTSYSILTSSGGAFNYFAAGGTAVALRSGTTLTTNGGNYLIFDGRGIPYTSSSASGNGSATSSNYVITISNSGGSEAVSISPETGEATAS